MKLLLLTRSLTKGQLKRVVYDTFGVSARTIENYLARAREEIKAEYEEETGGDSHLTVLQIINFCRTVMLDKSESTRDRLKAAAQQVNLLGLAAPNKVPLTTPDGSSLWRVPLEGMSDEELRALVALRERVRGTQTYGNPVTHSLGTTTLNRKD